MFKMDLATFKWQHLRPPSIEVENTSDSFKVSPKCFPSSRNERREGQNQVKTSPCCRAGRSASKRHSVPPATVVLSALSLCSSFVFFSLLHQLFLSRTCIFLKRFHIQSPNIASKMSCFKGWSPNDPGASMVTALQRVCAQRWAQTS